MDLSIEYLQDENVILCIDHCCALTLARLDAHLRSEHDQRPKQRQPTLRHFESIAQRATSPDEVCYDEILKNPPPFAYTNIQRPRQGYACRHCALRSPSATLIKAHVLKSHGFRGHKGIQNANEDDLPYRQTLLQTFFQNQKERRWFEVRSTPPPTAPLPEVEVALKRLLDEQWEQAEEKRSKFHSPAVIEAPWHKSMTNPWMKKTGWAAHLQGLNMQEVIQATKSISLPIDPRNPEPQAPLLAKVQTAVEEMLVQCTATIPELGSISLRLLGNFTGAIDGRIIAKPFDLMQEQATRNKYISHWSRFFLYIIRVHHFDRLPVVIQMTPKQLSALDKVMDIATAQGEMTPGNNTLVDAVRLASLAFLKQPLQRNPYESALVCYLAARAPKESVNAWMDSNDYTSILMGLIWDAQLLIADDCFREEVDSPDFDVEARIETEARRWLSNIKSSPISVLLEQKLYGSKVDSSKVGKITWSRDASKVVFAEKAFTMAELNMFYGKLFDEAEAILVKDLLLAVGSPSSFLLELMPEGRLATLLDNPNSSRYGYSFLDLGDNALARLSDLVKSKVPLGNAFVVRNGALVARNDHLAAYTSAFERFREYLLAIFYFAGGMPPRMTELQTLTWRNTEVHRNIFLYDRLVLFRLTYSKTEGRSGRSRPIGRFLPVRAARMMVLYLAAIHPYVCFLSGKDAFAKSALLLTDFEGKPWSTSKITAVLERLTTRIMGKRLNASSWRHLATAVGRKHLRLKPSELKHGDGDEEVLEGDAMVAQSGHSAQVERREYGQEVVLGDLLSWEFIEEFLPPSEKVHRFFGIDQDLTPPTTPRPAVRPTATPSQALSDPPKAEAVSAALRRLYGPTFTFRSEVQSAAVTTMLEGTKKELVVVMPTGAGKSVIFLLPPLVFNHHHLTVVIVPLRALLKDIAQRFAKADIDITLWTSGEAEMALDSSVVLVSADHAPSSGFVAVMNRAVLEGKLVRFVYDECHLFFTQQNFRSILQELRVLREFDQSQHVFLTATLPPVLRPDLDEIMLLQSPTYLHQPTRRANISYNVFVGEDLGSIDRKLKQLVTSSISSCSTIVYCRTKKESATQAKWLGCDYYYSDSPNGAEVLDRWLKGLCKIIVATGALGLGVDLANIGLVVHVGLPYGLIEYAQESGRAGRKNQRATSWILTCSDWESSRLREKDATNFGWDLNIIAMHNWMVSGECRRIALDSFMDGGKAVTCAAIDPDENLCDMCNSDFEGHVDQAIGLGADISEPARHAAPESILTSKVRSDAIRLDRLGNVVLPKYQGAICRFCMLYSKVSTTEHTAKSCPYYLEEKALLKIVNSKGKFQFPRFCACFDCGQPQGFCDRWGDEGGSEKACQFAGLVKEFLSIAFYKEPDRKRIIEDMKADEALVQGSPESLLLWASKERRVLGRRSCTAFEIMLHVLERAGEEI